MFHTRTLGLISSAAVLVLLAACTSNKPASSEAGGITVDSSADKCAVSTDTVGSGTLTFSVKNSGSDVTEFYLLADDGLRVVSEVENVGPGLTRNLTVNAKPGSYFTACKPGMVGDGIKAAFTVTDSGAQVGPTGDEATQHAAAAASYVSYVKDQSEQLLTKTEKFHAAYLAGDDDLARSLFAPTRMHWERIEPVAESFGDLDPSMDLREADLEEGQEWTGWHRIEKDLWPPTAEDNGGKTYTALTDAERTKYADKLLADTKDLNTRVHAADFTLEVDQIANGAIALLDEVANGKVTGEEEIWSHTDLWDFQANVDGAKVAYGTVRDIVAAKDPALATKVDERIAALQKLLDAQKSGDGWVLYDALSQADIKAFSDAVNALGESLGELTTTILGG